MKPDIAAALWTGVIAGVVATAIWAAIAGAHRWWRHWSDFGRLAGRYRVTPKLAHQSGLGTGVVLTISVRRNLLTVHFENLTPGDVAMGQIAMNENLPRSGQGHYEHMKSGQQLWGFWQLQVKDTDTLLVHNIYARRDAALVTQGFVWHRVPAQRVVSEAA